LLATRNTSGCHVLLLACTVGTAPEVIDCLLGWNTKCNGSLQWNDCNLDKDGALVLAARYGSLALVSHLLSFADEMDLDVSESNAPTKIIHAAIASGNEELVLFVLSHKKHDNVLEAIWLCWRKNHDGKNKITEVSSEVTTQIEAIAKNYQVNLIYELNPALLPLLVARLRYTEIAAPTTCSSDLHLIILVPDDIFQNIANFFFNADALHMRVEDPWFLRRSAPIGRGEGEW